MSAQHEGGAATPKIPCPTFSGRVPRNGSGRKQDGRRSVALMTNHHDLRGRIWPRELCGTSREVPWQKKAVINDTIEQVRRNLRTVIEDTQGPLPQRCQGASRAEQTRIVIWVTSARSSGINNTLDAVARPVRKAASVLNTLAAADLTARVRGDYQRRPRTHQGGLNRMAEALSQALGQVAAVTTLVARIPRNFVRVAVDCVRCIPEQAGRAPNKHPRRSRKYPR